ncbi:GNAT family N-acetyltransferase [Aquimarina sp. D1M17]|uniref:GNAT family N-acetyltransferase n=1 Tax=Aquimarina acroporae TaxID=2937283 RepID=UPI0020BF4D74|nr:GNAT family N-acetyltransferase [Aquimarina acroporae]MCK8522999.1 GNAT family N-acetyltransferase [Aquimarina acroporae]
MVIETSRLLLREMNMGDAQDMLRLYSRPEVQKYTGESVITTLEGIYDKIDEKRKEYKKYGYGRWITFLKEDMQFVGWAGLSYLPEFDKIDLGYRFLTEFWGKGIATEVSKEILQYGFETLQLEEIIAIAMKENIASIKVMQKVGMQFDKYAPYEPGGEDYVWYTCSKNSILKS